MANNDLKILVVDDSSLIRGIIRNELEAGGYQVIEAAHGFKALIKASESPQPDLITLDVEMPKLDGFETCRRLREDHYARFFKHIQDNMVPVIFVTSHDTIEDRKKGFDLGAMDFITKPFKEGEILKAVNKILRPENRLKGLTALVVNKNSDSRRMVSDCLRREGVTTIEAADGVQAFETMSAGTDSIDIVITGLLMPHMNGDELCKKIRNELNLKELPVIFLPVVDDKSELFELFKAGATDYLLQPFVKEEFLARLIVHLERTRLNKSLRNTLEQVEQFNKNITESIKYAKLIQTSLLPNLDEVKNYLPHSFFIWMPRDIVGGDIFYTYPFEDGVLVAVIDCTGHGVPGAFMTMIASSGLRRIIRTDQCSDPAKILQQLNQIVKTTLQQDTEYALSDDGLDAAICFVSDYREPETSDSGGLRLTFAGAHLPLYYTYNNEIHLIRGDNISIGYKRSDLDHNFTKHTIDIEKGMLFYLSTDGFTDQIGNTGRCMGKKNFKKLLLETSRQPFQAQKDMLVRALEEYKGKRERTDDVTLVGFGFEDDIQREIFAG
ncbi:response regulator [Desulfococcaceae bacterium HSG8]|nr:response regulator [Desulfococcaceae bacterium HSG8]